MMPPVFGIVGWKNSGKTTLMARLIETFAARSLRVAAIKHAHHAFDVDHEGRDSQRYRLAGAGTVIVSSSQRFAVMTELRGQPEPALSNLLPYAEEAHIVLVEGYKRDRHPKLEVRRSAALSQTPLSPSDPSICAIAADFEVEGAGLPVFGLDDIEAISKFILSRTNTLHSGPIVAENKT